MSLRSMAQIQCALACFVIVKQHFSAVFVDVVKNILLVLFVSYQTRCEKNVDSCCMFTLIWCISYRRFVALIKCNGNQIFVFFFEF